MKWLYIDHFVTFCLTASQTDAVSALESFRVGLSQLSREKRLAFLEIEVSSSISS